LVLALFDLDGGDQSAVSPWLRFGTAAGAGSAFRRCWPRPIFFARLERAARWAGATMGNRPV